MVKYQIFVLFLIVLSTNAYSYRDNLGHRAGGGKKEFFKDLPENSLIALQSSLEGRSGEGIDPIQYRKKFLYLEFDVQETKDHKIVVFHDKTIKRMIPNTGNNKKFIEEILERINSSSAIAKEYKKLKIKDLTLDEIKTLRLAGKEDQEVPTLDEFLEMAKTSGLIKPIVVEIKYFHTNKVKLELIKKVKDFRETYMDKVNIIVEKHFDFPETTVFLSFPKKFKLFKKLLGKKKTCNLFRESGFKGVFMPALHFMNFC